MKYIYNFNLKDVVNIDNYYTFLEIYLKENHILKKDFFDKTGICPNSYRFFLKNKEKNKHYYYGIISKKYNIIIPTNEQLITLSQQYSKIFEDILYKRVEKYEEDLKIIEDVLGDTSTENRTIASMHEIYFYILEVFLKISLGKLIRQDRLNILQIFIETLKSYKSLIIKDYYVLYNMLVITYQGLKNTIDENTIENTINSANDYYFFQPLMYKIISDSYYLVGNYINSVVYGQKSYDGFIQCSNFFRAVSIKTNIAYSYIMGNSFLQAYYTLQELYYGLENYNIKQQTAILRGMSESFIFLNKYEEVYELLRNHLDIDRVELQIEYAFVLYKLDKKEEFLNLYQTYMNKSNIEIYKTYTCVLEYIYSLYLKNENIEKNSTILRMTVKELGNSTFVKFCKFLSKM